MAAIKSGKKAIEVSSRVFDMFGSRRECGEIYLNIKLLPLQLWEGLEKGDARSHENDNFSPLHVPDLEQAKRHVVFFSGEVEKKGKT